MAVGMLTMTAGTWQMEEMTSQSQCSMVAQPPTEQLAESLQATLNLLTVLPTTRLHAS